MDPLLFALKVFFISAVVAFFVAAIIKVMQIIIVRGNKGGSNAN